MDPGEILRGHHISNFEKEITRDNRLYNADFIVKQGWCSRRPRGKPHTYYGTRFAFYLGEERRQLEWHSSLFSMMIQH